MASLYSYAPWPASAALLYLTIVKRWQCCPFFLTFCFLGNFIFFTRPRQIRAANTSGECSFNMELRRGHTRWGGQQKECVKRRAELSVKAHPGCSERVSKLQGQADRPNLPAFLTACTPEGVEVRAWRFLSALFLHGDFVCR